jgi:ribosome hibernation promoting factor
MQIQISGHQVDVTPALRDYVSSKLERLVRHFDHVIDVTVILSVEKLLHTAEANVQTSGKVMHADASGADMYAAIDALADKLDRQIKKHKEKITDHHAETVRSTRYG